MSYHYSAIPSFRELSDCPAYISIIEINKFLFILKNLQACINLASIFHVQEVKLRKMLRKSFVGGKV
jgi:hypothetical protein